MKQMLQIRFILLIFLITVSPFLSAAERGNDTPLEFPDEEIIGISNLKTDALKKPFLSIDSPYEPALDSLPVFFRQIAVSEKPVMSVQKHNFILLQGFTTRDVNGILHLSRPIDMPV